MATAAADPDNIPMRQVLPPVNDWWSWLARQGVFAAMLMIFAGWFGSAIIIPMRDDQRAFMQSVIKTNETHAEVEKKQTEIAWQQVEAEKDQAKAMIDQSQALNNLVPLLKEIRDDQRRGVWLDKPLGAKGGE